MRLMIMFLVGLFAIGPVWAQEEPGYVDFKKLDLPSGTESDVEIFLKGPLLRMISESTKDDDPEFAELLTTLSVIHVQSYSFDARDAERINDRVADTAEAFYRRYDWEPVVRVRSRLSSSHISLKMHNGRIAGLLLMVVEPKNEAFFVNIVGDIDLARIGRIGRKFNISQLEDIRLPRKD